MAFILTPIGRLTIVALITLLVFGLIYRAGQKSTEIDTLKDTVKAHETRDRIDTEVDEMGLFSRCLELGGLPEQCDKLRRLETPAKPE